MNKNFTQAEECGCPPGVCLGDELSEGIAGEATLGEANPSPMQVLGEIVQATVALVDLYATMVREENDALVINISAGQI